MGLACAPAEPRAVPTPDTAQGEGVAEDPAVADLEDASSAADPRAPAPDSATAVLARVQGFYDGTEDLTSSFKQTYVHHVYGTKTVLGGKLKIKKPGMMVWDYSKESDPDFYADKSKLWVIERDTRQVVTKDVSTSDFAGAVKFLFGGSRLLQEFRRRWASEGLVQRYGKENHDVIELVPIQANAHYKRLLLVVDKASGRVDAFVVLYADDSTNHFVLSNVQRNPGLAEEEFRFEVPPGYVVVPE